MNSKYSKIEFLAGNTIDKAVNELLDFRAKGILVCGDFNGITLYSDTVTMDDAYKVITGKTKSEFDDFQREEIEKSKRKRAEHQASIPSLFEEWRAKGRDVLDEDKWEYWDRIVPIRLDDLYQGMELGCCLEIAKILNNNGSLDEAKKEIESQGHSGMSFGLVCSMVKDFCDRGEEFVNYVR
jgi:hypothetical protein